MSIPEPNRRKFIQASAGVAAAAAFSNSSSTVFGQENPTVSAVNPVMVHHEWGTLKEVVCGIPYFKIPTTLPKAVYNYAPTAGIKFMEQHAGKTLEEADPETFKQTKQQMDATVAILEERGVKVHRPMPVDDSEAAYLDNIFPASAIQYFPRDPMVVIGNHFIETELLFPARRRERFGIRRALADRLADSNAEVVSMPPAKPSPEAEDGSFGPGPFIEGGDVFLNGRDIYVGVSGMRVTRPASNGWRNTWVPTTVFTKSS